MKLLVLGAPLAHPIHPRHPRQHCKADGQGHHHRHRPGGQRAAPAPATTLLLLLLLWRGRLRCRGLRQRAAGWQLGSGGGLRGGRLRHRRRGQRSRPLGRRLVRGGERHASGPGLFVGPRAGLGSRIVVPLGPRHHCQGCCSRGTGAGGGGQVLLGRGGGPYSHQSMRCSAPPTCLELHTSSLSTFWRPNRTHTPRPLVHSSWNILHPVCQTPSLRTSPPPPPGPPTQTDTHRATNRRDSPQLTGAVGVEQLPILVHRAAGRIPIVCVVELRAEPGLIEARSGPGIAGAGAAATAAVAGRSRRRGAARRRLLQQFPCGAALHIAIEVPARGVWGGRIRVCGRPAFQLPGAGLRHLATGAC